ncbi:RWD-domain-containing protein [Saccharata proteae CBS 121410]|uniref:RBR-type E3 ubiquitin transferase n=1 Tax=Saccharata proteae CBS 121410 TaxID=1314787 RepID=A0A9P4HR20_9PEZI|nr:RWD-domain-containing protein [Saccharata proteae CBS 121410]
MAEQEDERAEELSSIAAIFPELALDSDNPFAASIDLPIAPATPLPVVFPCPIDGAPPPPNSLPTPPTSDSEGQGQRYVSKHVHNLSYLPPLRLHVNLPHGYPAEAPPCFELSTSPNWLPDHILRKLEDEGKALWEEYGRMQVVFAYIDLVQQAGERAFDLTSDDSAALEIPEELKVALLDFDLKTKRAKFEQETFDCGICLEPKKGSVCYRMLRCSHVFCVACLQDFYNNCIKEGDVASVKCLDPTCGKEAGLAVHARKKQSKRTLNPSELLQIPLEKSTVQRYAELKRKKKLESDKSTVYCPRKWCQGPARSKKYPKITDLSTVADSDSESDNETPPEPRDKVSEQLRGSKSDERLAVCEDCNYAFCRTCLAGWHGDIVRCWPRSATELSAEEQASYDYMRLNTSQCPTCSVPCQKTQGCNHMSCFQCRTHFCYLCSAWLDPANPYQHFNTKDTQCYMRLWELEEGDEGNGNARPLVHAPEPPVLDLHIEHEFLHLHLEDGGNVWPNVRLPAAANARPRPRNAAPVPAPRPGNAAPAPQRGNDPVRNAAPAPGRRGLQRFLHMAQNDEEGDWDSDELDEEDFDWGELER